MKNAVFDSVNADLEWINLPTEKLDNGKVVSTGYKPVPASTANLTAGVWEHEKGTSFDEEAQEMFVIVSGKGKITIIETGEVLILRPGVVGALQPGTKTRWDIEENLRKVFITPRF